ncbi:uncharacterized protein LOC107360673 isoform X2 [Tetranychus urticae]|uniref:uncharacterized protein LOC107360673 isoform X2 n=1 Tax=Tetranychus urticae TaxID=32264 RepID=UPI000D64AAAC|nr:uncharacterized protein LOC107360673 isoform X2 [Tetranychus urticae]
MKVEIKSHSNMNHTHIIMFTELYNKSNVDPDIQDVTSKQTFKLKMIRVYNYLLSTVKSKKRQPKDHFYGVKYVSYLDKMIVKCHFLNQGLTTERRPMKQMILYEISLFIINLFTVVRLLLVLFWDEKSPVYSQLVLYLGEGYIGLPNRKLVLTLFLLAQSCFWLIKLTSLWCELTNNMKILDELAVVRKSGFDSDALKLRNEDCKRFQKISIVILGNIKAIIIILCFSVSSIHIFFQQSCWHFLNGLTAKTLTFIWSIFIVTMICMHTTVALIGTALLLFGFSYVKFRHDSITSNLKLLSKLSACPVAILQRTIYDHIDIYNLFDLCNVFSRPILFVMYVPFTLFADLTFFFVTVHGVDSKFVSYVATVIISIAVAGFALSTYLIGNIHSKSSMASKQLHKLILHAPFNVRVNLKALFLLERILETPVGISSYNSVVTKEHVVTVCIEIN